MGIFDTARQTLAARQQEQASAWTPTQQTQAQPEQQQPTQNQTPTYQQPQTTRDQAWTQYQDAYRNAGAGDLLEGDYAGEAQREFGDWWKNASLDSGELQGDQYQQSWSSLMPQLQQRISGRIAERNPGVVQPDSNAPQGSGSGAGSGTGSSQAMTTWTGGDPNTQQRRGDLWDMLMGRAQQGINVDRLNPAVRGQADAYAANEERARRNYVSDVAESSGPYANIRGQERMAAERMGQRTGAFEAELVGREIAAKRQEIEHALTTMSHLLPEDQRLELQRYLAELDNAYKMNALSSENDRFASQLGFDYADRNAYWDAVRRGIGV